MRLSFSAIFTPKCERILAKLREPSAELLILAARTHYDWHVGGPNNSVWESPLTDQEYQKRIMAIVLQAVAVKIEEEVR